MSIVGQFHLMFNHTDFVRHYVFRKICLSMEKLKGVDQIYKIENNQSKTFSVLLIKWKKRETV